MARQYINKRIIPLVNDIWDLVFYDRTPMLWAEGILHHNKNYFSERKLFFDENLKQQLNNAYMLFNPLLDGYACNQKLSYSCVSN